MPAGIPPTSQATTTAPTVSTTTSGSQPKPSSPSVSTTAVPPTGSLPFPADTEPDISTTHVNFPILVGVTEERHAGYDRYLFEFFNNDPGGHQPLGSARSAWDVRYVPTKDVVMDGTGRPVSPPGSFALRILFRGTAVHYDDGSDSLRGSLPSTDQLVFGGDYEGRVTWFLGFADRRPFRAVFVENRTVAVDVVA